MVGRGVKRVTLVSVDVSEPEPNHGQKTAIDINKDGKDVKKFRAVPTLHNSEALQSNGVPRLPAKHPRSLRISKIAMRTP